MINNHPMARAHTTQFFRGAGEPVATLLFDALVCCSAVVLMQMLLSARINPSMRQSRTAAAFVLWQVVGAGISVISSIVALDSMRDHAISMNTTNTLERLGLPPQD